MESIGGRDGREAEWSNEEVGWVKGGGVVLVSSLLIIISNILLEQIVRLSLSWVSVVGLL